MHVEKTKLDGLIVIHPQVFRDQRGEFSETYRLERYQDIGIDSCFVQDNYSHSKHGTLRGLHIQFPFPQGKLICVTRGQVFDVAVDLRTSSSTYSQWAGVWLDDREHRQLYVPPGFAHGFCVVSRAADILYKCTDYYRPECQHTIRWNDPQIAVDWPLDNPLLSERDAGAPMLADFQTHVWETV